MTMIELPVLQTLGQSSDETRTARRPDWLKVKELRAEKATLIFNRQQGQLKSLSFEKADQKMKLECSEIELADICLCRP